MQIIILGMHRSGTSLLTQLINQMGLYFGEKDDAIAANDENPYGFWERRDVRIINDYVLHNSGSDWNKLFSFNENSVTQEVTEHFTETATNIVKNMDEHAPWVMKEPRLCVLMRLWKSVLTEPIYIFIYRNPVEVASSLLARNGIAIPDGIALWEKYNIEAINGAKGSPLVMVSHQKLMSDPVAEVQSIYEQLVALGVENLRALREEDVFSLVDSTLHRQRYSASEIGDYLNVSQSAFFKQLEAGDLTKIKSPLQLSASSRLLLKNFQENTNRHELLQAQYQEQFSARENLATEHKSLIAKYDNATTQHKDLNTAYKKLIVEHKGLADKHRDLIVKYDGKTTQHKDLNTAYKKLTGEHKGLADKHRDLIVKYDGKTTQHRNLNTVYKKLS